MASGHRSTTRPSFVEVFLISPYLYYCRYGWRYQIIGLKKAGFRCIVPSTLGYAGSSKPDDLRAYGFKAMSTDLKNLLSAIGIEEPVLLFGHDW